MEAPILIKAIPSQIVNERAAYGPFNLKDYIKAPDGSTVQYSAELKDGAALPKGLICTSDGLLTGIPAKDTQGNYEFTITAFNDEGTIQTSFYFTIKPSLENKEADYIDKLKAQVWVALEQRLPIPELAEMYDRPITQAEVYYLLERWAMLKVWDAFNLDPPTGATLLNLEGASPHYNVYDCGSYLVAAPKDLFSHERTIEDGLQTARALAREVYKRNWTIELAGFDKLMRAAWIELQHLAYQHGRKLEIVNYEPTQDDLKLYTSQVNDLRLSGIE